MKGLKPETRLLLSITILLLLLNAGQVKGQNPKHYSEFRKEFFELAIDYKLEEALTLCEKSDEGDKVVLAAKSVVYSLMGNRDKNKSYLEKGFDLVKPYKSLEDDFNIHVALAVSHGMQANHAGLKKKIEFADQSISHCKEALKLNASLPHPNFIPGRFYFELAGMCGATAKLAPSRFLYNYYTGAAYKESGNEEKAMHYFHLADKDLQKELK